MYIVEVWARQEGEGDGPVDCDKSLTGEPILPFRTANHYLANRVPPRGWDGCTFVGADLRVCGLWVRSRSLAANHAEGPGYILLPA